MVAAGPLFAAPLSEEYGRNALYVPFMMVFVVLQIGVALVDNVGGFLVLRLLSGIAVSPPATLGAGTITDVPPLPPFPSQMYVLYVSDSPGVETRTRTSQRGVGLSRQSVYRTGPGTHCRGLRD